jgi:hypothetical protein
LGRADFGKGKTNFAFHNTLGTGSQDDLAVGINTQVISVQTVPPMGKHKRYNVCERHAFPGLSNDRVARLIRDLQQNIGMAGLIERTPTGEILATQFSAHRSPKGGHFRPHHIGPVTGGDMRMIKGTVTMIRVAPFGWPTDIDRAFWHAAAFAPRSLNPAGGWILFLTFTHPLTLSATDSGSSE